jgi:hypothetical protein
MKNYGRKYSDRNEKKYKTDGSVAEQPGVFAVAVLDTSAVGREADAELRVQLGFQAAEVRLRKNGPFTRNVEFWLYDIVRLRTHYYNQS